MIDDVELAVFVFPAASANTPIATEIAPVPDCVLAVGVNTAVYTVDDVADIDASVPPVAVASRDPVRAYEAMREHIDCAAAGVCEFLAARESAGGVQRSVFQS